MKLELTEKESHIIKIALQCLADCKLGLLENRLTKKATPRSSTNSSPPTLSEHIDRIEYDQVLRVYSNIRRAERNLEDRGIEKELYDGRH